MTRDTQRWLYTVALTLAMSACGESDGAAADAAGTSQTSVGDSGAESGEASDSREPGAQSLVAVDGWMFDEMPPPMLAADRPAAVVCDNGWGVEDGVFEVDSEFCNWGAFVQPSLAQIKTGDTIELIVLHDTLFSDDEGASAHVALGVGDLVIWETTLMIPTAAGLVRPSIVATEAAPVGTPIRVHVHNHGYNNYRFVDITVTPP